MHIALITEGPNAARVRGAGAVLHHLPHPRAWDLRAVARIAWLARSLRADLVQTWLTRMDLWGGAAAQLARLPWVISERSSSAGTVPAKADQARFALGRYASAVVANSRTAADEWRSRVRRGTPVVTIPNAMPANEIDATQPAARALLGIPEGAPLVLYAGRFSEPKNPRVLADTFAKTLTQRPEAWGLLCGEGPDLDAVRATLRDAGVLPRCVLPGYRQDLWSWMKSAEVFVSLSLYEGRPNVVQEALRCGIPSVISDIAAHREFIPERAVRYVGARDSEAAARAVCALLDDRAEASALSARGREATSGITLDAIAEAYRALYEEVLSRG